jgi:hypothetical protein
MPPTADELWSLFSEELGVPRDCSSSTSCLKLPPSRERGQTISSIQEDSKMCVNKPVSPVIAEKCTRSSTNPLLNRFLTLRKAKRRPSIQDEKVEIQIWAEQEGTAKGEVINEFYRKKQSTKTEIKNFGKRAGEAVCSASRKIKSGLDLLPKARGGKVLWES